MPCGCTNLLPGAGHPDAVLGGDLGRGVGARARVLGEAQVVVGAQVDHVPHDPARVTAREKDRARW